MRLQYFIKATLEEGIAGYDHSTKYHMGENKHPAPDLSPEVCSQGIHLARNIGAATWYVSDAKEFYLAKAGSILGQDETKIRTDIYYQLWMIPQSIIDDYNAKRKPLDDDYHAKCKLLDDDYDANRKDAKLQSLNDDYDAKRKSIIDDYLSQLQSLNRVTMRRILRQYHKEVKNGRI